jgi:hypothetical protein
MARTQTTTRRPDRQEKGLNYDGGTPGQDKRQRAKPAPARRGKVMRDQRAEGKRKR